MKKKKSKHKPCSYLPIDPAKPRRKDTIKAEKDRRAMRILLNNLDEFTSRW